MLVSLYLIAFFISIIAILILVVGDKRQNIFYLFAFVCVAIACLGYLEIATSTTVEKAMFANGLTYFGGAFLMFFTLGAIFELCNIKKNTKISIALIVITLCILTLIYTNDFHHLYYKTNELRFDCGVALLEHEDGPLHILYTIYLVAYFIAMVSVSIYTLIKNKTASYKTSIIIALLVLFNIASYFLQKIPSNVFQFVCISYVISEYTLLYLLINNEAYDSNRASLTLQESNQFAIVIFDSMGHFKSSNKKALEIIPGLNVLRRDEKIPLDNDFLQDNFAYRMRLFSYSSTDKVSYFSSEGKDYRVEINYLLSATKKRRIGYIFLISDDTNQQLYIKEKEKNHRSLIRQMKIVKSLNFINYKSGYINVKEKTIIPLNNEELNFTLGERAPYDQYIKEFIEQIIDDDKENVLSFLDLENVKNSLFSKSRVMMEAQCSHFGWIRITLIKSDVDDEKNVKHVMLTVQEIDEEKNKELAREKQLLDAMEEAKRANNAKTGFLSRMSHDIRTPINGIMGMLDIASKNSNDQEKVEECLNKIRTASSFLLSLINDVLDMNKLESGEIIIPHNPMNLQEIVNSCLEIISPQLVEKGIVLKTEFNNNDINNVYGSSLHFRQVLLNVLSNAYKYNKKNGQIIFKIDKINVSNNIVTYKYTISDTGIGMSEEFQKKLFTPFSQENEGTRSEYGGTGLGLSIVKRIIDIVGGSINVISKKGEGTTFEIIWPFEINNNLDETKTTIDEIDYALLKNKNILLVEDNDLNMEIASYILEENEIKVTKAHDGQEALSIFKDSPINHFDIILMDVMMPVLGGYEATRSIRKLKRKDAKTVPIFAMTANAFAEDIEATKEAGMNEHITKPIDNKELLAKICKYLKRK
ncbi:MAG: ATP-binding protein [Bacilli bacterium]